MTDLNVSQFKGEEQELVFTIQDDNGDIIDLTQDDVENVHLDVATDLNRYGETKFEKTSTDTNSSGEATFIIEETDTENFRPGNYLYEVWVEFGSNDNYTAEIGKYFVKPRVDR